MVIRNFAALLLAVFIVCHAEAAVFFSDDFESGTTGSTNAGGFDWYLNNKTGIVSMNPSCGQPAGTPTLVQYNDAFPCTADTGKNWTTKNGNYSLYFLYPAAAHMSEQRFRVSTTPQPDLWSSYWIRVPVNYSHGFGGGGATNQKFFTIWQDEYGIGNGVSIFFLMERSGEDSTIYPIRSGGGLPETQLLTAVPFIDASVDRGRWMHLVYHTKTETSVGASDGVLQMWRRWDGDPAYTLLLEVTGHRVVQSTTVPGFRDGYLMGWANGSYSEDTEWLIDDFKLSTTDLRESGGVTTKVNTSGNTRFGSGTTRITTQ